MNEGESTTATTADEDNSVALQDRAWFKVLLCIAYIIIFLLGVGGNAAVCFILYRRKSLRTVTNFFILNLAISDLIFSFSIPFELPLILSNYEWPFASFFCKIYNPVQTIAFSVSIFTLTAVSITRYRAINHPLKLQLSLSRAHYVVVGIWILSTLVVVPYVLALGIKGTQCGEEWPKLVLRKMYTTFLFVIFYAIPLFIIVFTYMTILRELMKKRNCDNSALNEAWNNETAKVVRMIFKITVVFAVCNLPSQLMWLWLDFGKADQTFAYFWDLLAALNILVFANSAANPFIYYICHDKFRTEAVACLSNCKLLKRLRRCCRRIWVSRGHLHFGIDEEGQEINGIEAQKTLENEDKLQPASKIIDKTQESYV